MRDTHLGGEDFDNALVDHIINISALKKKIKIKSRASAPEELGLSARALKRIRVACERAKRQLSSATSTTIQIDALFANGDDFSTELTRAKFDKINEKPFNRCLDTVKRVLKDGKLAVKDVDDIVLVGGSSIPRVQQLSQKLFQGQRVVPEYKPR